MPKMSYREAVCKALADELHADEDVIFFGEDMAEAGGVFKVTPGLYEEFGPTGFEIRPSRSRPLWGPRWAQR